jgi:hypothetical protein
MSTIKCKVDTTHPNIIAITKINSIKGIFHTTNSTDRNMDMCVIIFSFTIVAIITLSNFVVQRFIEF